MKSATRVPIASRLALVTLRHARYNSTSAPESAVPAAEAAETTEVEKELDPRKQWLKQQNDLQRDWDAKELTYEEVKPRTEQPTPVRSSLYLSVPYL